jgi:hypothetical protein
MTQTLRTVSALFSRLGTVYTDQLELSHSAPAPTRASANSFLTGIDDVFCIMVHETDGDVVRNRAKAWFDDYRNTHGTGGGPQLVVWADGTVMSLVELPYLTTHGNSQNDRAIGIETGHGNDGRFGDVDIAPDASSGHTVRNGWHELSNDLEDITGSASVKFFAARLTPRNPPPPHAPAGYPTFDNEVVVAPWTTNNYQTPAREPPGPLQTNMYQTLIAHHGHAPPQPTMMVFTEWHYRSWALLTRYLCEALLVPRNFPVMPHARRDHAITNADLFKKLVLADERFDMIVNGLTGTYHGTVLNFAAADFTGSTPADLNRLHGHYAAAHVNQGAFNFGGFQNVEMNLAWLRFFDFYRGIHGHGFSGNQIVGQDDHDCPGPLFDWHRFAREVWDWWWYPFDFDATHAHTSATDRSYRRADGNTALVEYFFYDQPTFYINRTTAPGGIQGTGSSPDTFMLEQNSAVYALANGELVAAHYPIGGDASGNVSMAFVLVRHEVFHTPDLEGVQRQLGAASPNDAAHGGLADIGRIDYGLEPTPVYSLYMHLGRHENMNFGQVDDHNPDWLNRVLIRMGECDLARPPANPGTVHASLNAWTADFTRPPSQAGVRPTLLEAWQIDQSRYRRFLDELTSGQIAVAPVRATTGVSVTPPIGPTPIRVILGDYLGVAGVIRRQAGVPTHGVRIEVFSPGLVSALFFNPVRDQVNWTVPSGVTNPALLYQSEWSRIPNATESAALQAIGVDPTLVPWWSVVSTAQLWDVQTPQDAKLATDGRVYHYSPINFIQWINDVTWTSEWPKYRVVSGTPPAPVARPAAPRNLRF